MPSRFEIGRSLGAGGMGEVNEAFDRVRNTQVALKTLAEVNPDKLLALKQEFRSVVHVSHPNLVTMYDLVSENGRWYLSMEYVGGTDFLSWVRPLDRCDVARLRQTVPQIVRAVGALHGAGILHRDLKPSNVLVTPDGHVMVLDFGLAAPIHAATFDGAGDDAISGTVAYMSPEHSGSAPLTAASDWYSLGTMLYEALTGRLPYSGNALQIMADRQLRDATPVTDVAPDAPADLAAIVDGLLRRDAGARFSGAEVLRVLNQPEARAAPHSAAPLFVGRAAELAVLRDAFNGLAAGPRIVSVHGQSGIGKSALIARFLTEVSDEAMILAGRCYEQESVPFKAFDSAFDKLSGQLAQLSLDELSELLPRDIGALAQIFPVLHRVEPVAAAAASIAGAIEPSMLRRRAFAALRELLAALAARRALVIYLDDLQWADLDSAAMLREILRPPAAPRLMLISAWRRGLEDKSPLLDALQSESVRAFALDVRELSVGPLTPADTRALARAILPREAAQDGARVEVALRESAGNPYLLRELVSGVGEGPAGDRDSPDQPLTLEQVLRRRVAALPADARLALEIVSVAGRPLHEDDLRRAAGLDRADVKTLALLRARNLVQGAAEEIEPYHDRVRETVVESLDPQARRAHHARLADALRASSASQDAETLAGHLEAAGQLDEAGRHYVLAAERAATSLAFQRAADLFGKALALSGGSPDQRRHLQTRLADALANAGRVKAAALNYREAGLSARGTEAVELARKEATWFITGGYMAEGRAALERFLPATGMSIPTPRTLPWRLLWTELRLATRGLRFPERRESQVPARLLERIDRSFDATRSFIQTDTPTGFYFVNRNLLLALDAGEPGRVARILPLKLAGVQGFRSAMAAKQVRAYRTALDALSRRLDSPYVHGMAAWSDAYDGFFAGDYSRMHRQMLVAERIFTDECTGVAWERSTSTTYSLVALAHLGRVSSIMVRLEDVLRDGEERESRIVTFSVAVHAQPFAYMGIDRPERALEVLDAAREAWGSTYTLQVAATAFLRTWVLLYQGRADAAWTFVSGEWPRLRQHNYMRLHQLWNWAVHARAQAALALALEHPEDRALVRVAERSARLLEADTVCAVSPGVAQLIRAGVAARRGRHADAMRLLERAVPVFEASGMTAFAGVARRRLGELTGGDAGAQMIARADASMRAVGIVQPARMTRAFANGF
jgi:hypothetical protein